MKRHLLSAADLDRDDALLVLDTAAELARLLDRPTGRSRSCRPCAGAPWSTCSSRTPPAPGSRSRRPPSGCPPTSSTSPPRARASPRARRLKDTALTLEAMGADAVVIRHGASGAPHRLAYCGLDRAAASSTPATAPTSTRPRRCSTRSRCAATSRGGSGDLAGRRVTIVGDVLHSRVARSNVLLLATLGAEVTLVAPPTLLPVGVETWPCAVVLRPRRGAARVATS